MSAPGKSNLSVHFAGNEPEPSAHINTNACLCTCKYINKKRTRTNAGTPEKHKHNINHSATCGCSAQPAAVRASAAFSVTLATFTLFNSCNHLSANFTPLLLLHAR